MWELNHKEGWAPRNLCFWTVVLEKTLESFLDRKEIKPVNPEGNELWIVIGRTDADAEAAILWPPDRKIWLIGKDPNAGKDWGKEKGTTKDEMVGWHHWLNGHEFTQKLHEIMKDGEAWCAAVHGVTKSWTLLSGWKTTICIHRHPLWRERRKCINIAIFLLTRSILLFSKSFAGLSCLCLGSSWGNPWNKSPV